MGNRGNVVFVSGETISPNIYLHWNGGPESVYAWLEELDRRNVRPDGEYEAARFVQIVGEMFSADGGDGGHGLSLGITSAPLGEITAESMGTVHTDSSDNGFYVVDRSGPVLQVRRFLEDRSRTGYPCPMVELEPIEVMAERAGAECHHYREAFRRFYTELEAWRECQRVGS